MRAGSNWRHLNGLSLGMMGDPVRCLPKVVHPDVAALKLQHNPRQYQETDTDRDARLIAYLIDVVLLHRHVEFPPAGSPQESALTNWSVVGRTMLGQHPGDGTS